MRALRPPYSGDVRLKPSTIAKKCVLRGVVCVVLGSWFGLVFYLAAPHSVSSPHEDSRAVSSAAIDGEGAGERAHTVQAWRIHNENHQVPVMSGTEKVQGTGWAAGPRPEEVDVNWKTCKTYTETSLPDQRKHPVERADRALKVVKPRDGVEWDLAVSENLDYGWLGLHFWDDRFTYGSTEADRRVRELGYCRVHMPSIPRSGSTWFRVMFEVATGQPTFSMWNVPTSATATDAPPFAAATPPRVTEGGSFKKDYLGFSSDDPCGASPREMEGGSKPPNPHPCRNLSPPNATSPIMFKSHTPYYPSYDRPSLMPDKTCITVLLVRNPMDTHDAMLRYERKPLPLRPYLPVWAGHLSHWILDAGDTPILVFRYEDLLYRPAEVLKMVLRALPGNWRWSEESVAEAVRLYGPKASFEDKCGKGVDKNSLAEVEMVRNNYGGLLRHFGYRFIRRS